MTGDDSADILVRHEHHVQENGIDNIIVQSNGKTIIVIETTINEKDEDREIIHRLGNTDVIENGALPSSDECQSPSATPTKLYYRRWYVLIVFSLITFTQDLIWNTWGPLANSAKVAFDWDDAQIALMTNWGPICYVLTAIQFSWLLDVKGLKVAITIASALLLVGSGLRCITMTPPAVTWLVHAGQICGGLSGPVGSIVPPMLSSAWFPAEQRATVTAIGVLFAGLGSALAFIAGPLFVPTLSNANATTGNNSFGLELRSPFNNHTADIWGVTWKSSRRSFQLLLNGSFAEADSTSQSPQLTDVEITRNNIHTLMYIEFAWSAALFLLVLIYFPSKPPFPPSLSASTPRVEFKSGLKALTRHRLFWMLVIPFAVSTGVFTCWSTVLDILLGPLGISEETAGWIGFYGTVAGQVTAFFVGRSADIFARRMRIILIILYTLAALVFSVFAIECAQIIPFQIATLFVTMIVGSACIYGVMPLFYELACESTYPVAEGVTSGVMTWLQNFTGLIFLLAVMFPINMSWTSWMLVGSITVCLPIFFLYKERYGRLDVDNESKASTSSTSTEEPNNNDDKQLITP